ncbi:hypothetical protein AQUCO_02400109v1 [Aquilegia coerulea]|uniref:Uncharacterized protein n=1 Tax=Aquilegia coerulea TaxID=218851 RepID=A0A2G5DC68_AQUCA|nr:hypothetical protein AQUCO_02400109v1 [Aquilegia coerulea]PIA40818.1 hypothetical protein AQUCO_02400109v1 [Aquilegia coerulea]PIA40819.1 hypothetical protein AQUCO_02400109v1 [Aquilegia coerulea]
MGTTLQHAVDLLAILPKKHKIYGIHNSDFREVFENHFLQNPLTGGSMDRRLEQFNQESVRITMLKHEEIFKEQVRELHRLYKVQKMLMTEMRKIEPNLHSPTTPSSRPVRVAGKCIDIDNRPGFWTTATTSETNQIAFTSWNHSSSNQPNVGYNFHPLFSMRADPSLQEQSSSCSRDTSKTPKGFDLEQPAEEISNNISAIEDSVEPNLLRPSKDIINSNNSCNPSFHIDGEGEIELTLSIGLGTSKKKTKHRKPHTSQELGSSSSSNYDRRQLESSLSMRSDRGEECSDPTNSTSTATCDRETLQQPPWLFQALSLNRT